MPIEINIFETSILPFTKNIKLKQIKTNRTSADSILLDVIFNPRNRGGFPEGGTAITYSPILTTSLLKFV